MIGDRVKDKGFTLVEVLVATGVLVMLVTVVVGIYVTTISAQNRTFARQNALDSSRFALESMARTIRQSQISSASGSTLVLVNHPTKGAVTFNLNSERLEENGEPITSSNVSVDVLTFTADGEGASDGEQARVTIFMEIRSTNAKENEQATVPLQTTITPRRLDS